MLDNLQSYADQLLVKHRIPAVSLAVWKDGQLLQAASGTLNLDTGVEATSESIFQIGSITKVFTTCLIMKLVEDRRVDLDAPVVRYLRDFQLADKKAAEAISVRQLLNHTNGITGDYYADDLKEDGPHIARYVDRCSQLPLVHPVGKGFSYSNAAFSIAGRLIEVMLGMSWHEAMEALIFQPLGMTHAISRPAEVIRFRTAIGHIADQNHPEQWHTCSGKYVCLGMAPAGLTPTMSASDLITFARAHLEGGVNCSGERWLSEDSVQLMQQPTVEVPISSDVLTTCLGLGWFICDHLPTGRRYLQHAGLTNGQSAMLRVFSDHQACFAVLLNSNKAGVLDSICSELNAAVAGIESDPISNRDSLVLSRDQLRAYQGHYKASLGDFNIELSPNGLVSVFDITASEEPPIKIALRPLGDHCFDIINEQGILLWKAQFKKLDDKNVPQQLFAGNRLYQRVSE